MTENWRIRRYFTRAAPVGIFLATLGLALWLSDGQVFEKNWPAFAENQVVQSAAPETGRVYAIPGEVGQEVQAGDVVARLDPSSIDAEIRFASADLDRIEAQRQAEGLRARHDDFRVHGQLLRQVASAQVGLVEAEATLLQARAREEALRSRRDRLKALVGDGLATAEELAGVEVEYAEAAQQVATLPRQIQALKNQLEGVTRERTSAPAASESAVKTSFDMEREGLLQKIAWLKTRRSALDLKAAASGRISHIYYRPGEGAQSGSPIVSVVPSSTRRIWMCLPETDALALSPGSTVSITALGANHAPYPGRVLSVSPRIEELPVRCNYRVGRPLFGRLAFAQVDETDFLPGQALSVTLVSSPQADVGPLHREVIDQVRDLADPAVLASISNLGSNPVPDGAGRDQKTGDARPLILPSDPSFRVEPSGLVWIDRLKRFLLVSDDTGQEGPGRHRPIVFLMNTDGSLDDSPVEIRGVESLNDGEAIAAGPNGTVYLLSSQSYNREGRRRTARTRFLQLVPDGDHYRVTGKVHLAELLEAQGEEFLTELGLPGTTRDLDLEGLAWRDGSLYIGTKAPVDGAGLSSIWRLDQPEALFRSGTLAPGSLQRWASVVLTAEVDGKPVQGGISELLFLPDGSLLLASTPSDTKGGLQSGRMWRVARPSAGVLEPELIRTFVGLKPEGLSISAGDCRVTVVFDAGDQPPSWVEMPCPR